MESNKEKFIGVHLTNQLPVLEDIEKNERNEEQINELDLYSSNYNLTSKFIVVAIDDNITSIMLGSSSL